MPPRVITVDCRCMQTGIAVVFAQGFMLSDHGDFYPAARTPGMRTARRVRAGDSQRVGSTDVEERKTGAGFRPAGIWEQ